MNAEAPQRPGNGQRLAVASWWVAAGLLMAWSLTAVLGAQEAVQETLPDEPTAKVKGEEPQPAFSAWYRFKSPAHLGRSTGPTPWPALAHQLEWCAPGEGRWGGA